MTQQTDSQLPVGRMVLAGTGIGLGAILLFGLIWVGLGQLGADAATRLAAAVCTPPAVMSVVIIWFVFTRRESGD